MSAWTATGGEGAEVKRSENELSWPMSALGSLKTEWPWCLNI